MPFLQAVFSSGAFMPHGHCYLWEPGLVWLHVVSDVSIWLAYVAISATLLILVRRVRDLPFQWIYIAFGVFIVSCGFTHFMEVWTVWKPLYWLSGGIKAITAFASVGTAVILPALLPKVSALAQSVRVADEKGIELETAFHDLGSMYEKARELEKLKTDFFANVSHELRTPLALILGPTEKLLATAVGKEERRDLELIARNARTLLKHVNDLLEVAKLEAGKVTLDYSAVDAARLIRRIASHFEGNARERSIEFELSTPETAPVEIDQEKLDRVFLNLFSNAFRYASSDGKVSCRVRLDDGNFVVEIGDSGPGVRPELRKVIFERFRQGDGGSTRQFGGTGLGLAIARDFVEMHGGFIGVGDAEEGGALFTVRVPAKAPAGAVVRRMAPGEEARLAEAARQSLETLRTAVGAAEPSESSELPTVLVVEDNPEMNRFICENLSKRYRAVPARDGAEGLRLAADVSPDLVLADVMMPIVSGDAMVREMRARREFDGVPVILLTAKADDELRLRLLREGAQDYLMKPFSVEELRARIDNLVTMKRARDVLRRELASHVVDLEKLAGEAVARKRELESALESMRVAREHAENAGQIRNRFLQLVSHELKTPLTSLQLQLDGLRRDSESLTPRQRDLVERMRRSSVRLLDLIEAILEQARIEAGRLSIQVAPFVPAELAAEIVEELKPQAESSGSTITLDAPSSRPFPTDPRLFRLILANLLGNAIKHGGPGAITVAVHTEDGTCRLTVGDRGPGIPAEKQAMIFEPFAQLESVDAKHTPGVGLGLALVRDIVRALGGEVILESVPGRGALFVVTLPARI
ncbi:MAG TPA: ATP-binding protein [Thermoanaerobaculia bacterium]|nr:ATP-binding protein [Thermoanaerobaculia bacterium]